MRNHDVGRLGRRHGGIERPNCGDRDEAAHQLSDDEPAYYYVLPEALDELSAWLA